MSLKLVTPRIVSAEDDSDSDDEEEPSAYIVGFCTAFIKTFRGQTSSLPIPVYDPASWLQTVFAFNGSAIPACGLHIIGWTTYGFALYMYQLHSGFSMEFSDGIKFFNGFCIFAMVFRLSSANARYLEGLDMVNVVTTTLGGLIQKALCYADRKTPAKTEEDRQYVSRVKADLCRFAILTGNLFQMQNRLSVSADQDDAQHILLLKLQMARSRGLLYDHEFQELNARIICRPWYTRKACTLGTYRKPTPIPAEWAIQKMRMIVGGECGISKHGYVERVMSFFEHDFASLQAALKAIMTFSTVPVPVAYVQMSRLLMTIFLVLFPMQIEASAGIFENVFFPGVVALVFNCLDVVCYMMEDPFGDDPMDIGFMWPMSTVEANMMAQLSETSDSAGEYFEWLDLPADDTWLRPIGVTRIVSLRSERNTLSKLLTEAPRA